MQWDMAGFPHSTQWCQGQYHFSLGILSLPKQDKWYTLGHVFQSHLSTSPSSKHLLKRERKCSTVRWENFKQNWKTIQQDLRRIKEHASEIQNIFFSKSSIEGRGIHLLGSTADSAQFRPNWLCYLAGGFHALRARISKKICSESLKHAL